jgi:hypothetical protein
MARDYGYIISPSLTWYHFKPGDKIQGEFTFTNSFITGEPEEQTFVLSSQFIFQENGEKKIYAVTPNDLTSYDLTPWMNLPNKEFTLKQNESVKIPYEITIPADTNRIPSGGKYGAVVISKKSSLERTDTTGAALEDKIAYQILGEIVGTEKKDSEILDFSVNKQIFWLWPNEQAEFTIEFANKGNVAFLPAGDIFVHTGDITKSIWTETFNPNQLIILPENSRSYTTTWKPTGPFLKTDQNGFTINLDYLRIGRYIATAKVGYDRNGSRIIVDRLTTFWILPIPLIVAILTSVLVILGFLQWRKRKSHK